MQIGFDGDRGMIAINAFYATSRHALPPKQRVSFTSGAMLPRHMGSFVRGLRAMIRAECTLWSIVLMVNANIWAVKWGIQNWINSA
jgi:hypothetical protein